MLGKPLAAAIAVALLFCGATVSLEALGLLFHRGALDPQQRVEAFVARLEADLSSVDLPTEPVEIPHETAQEVPERVAETAPVVAEPALNGAGVETGAEFPNAHRGGQVAAAFTGPFSAQSDATVEPGEDAGSAASEPEMPAAPPAPLPTAHAPNPEPEVARAAPRANAPRRAASSLGPVGYAAFGWPVLDWLTW
jgi:hypothetical protein